MPARNRPHVHLPAARPADEQDRLAVLDSYGVLDTAPEERFDEITRHAAEVCGMPLALVSLIDADRQWFKSHHGTDLTSTPREVAFCAHALLQPDELLVVEDATRDPRFAGNPLVTGEPGLRAYAGTPLVSSEGQPLGTLCVLDTEPRQLGERQLEALRLLGRQVVAQLELDRSARRLAASERALARLRDSRPAPDAALLGALDRGELVVHHQPFWSVSRSGGALRARVSGAEALVRWQHPERGLLLPGEFVPAMEACGLAARLGEQVLEAAVRDVAGWERAGLLDDDFRVHVNLSAAHLHDGSVAATVGALLDRYGVAPERLCLEVTETALLDTAAFSPAQARELVSGGLSLALDDFGTGFSSLTQLRTYPFSCVKVDRSFVAGLGHDPRDEVIVDTVVTMALRMGIVPVCEGVETPAQLDRVVEAGCTEVQGWLFGKASDAGHWAQEVLRAGEQVLLRAAPPADAPAPRVYDGGLRSVQRATPPS